MRIIKIVLATFFSWIILNVIWVAVSILLLNAKAKAANLPPGGAMAIDILGLKAVLFHSPWYWATVAMLVIGGVVFAVRAGR